MDVMPLTARSRVHYTLFAPFPMGHLRHFGRPPVLRTARAWARRCCRLRPESGVEAGAFDTADSARFDRRARCASEIRAAASTMRRAWCSSAGSSARSSAVSASASTAATTRSSPAGATTADAAAREREAAARHAPQQYRARRPRGSSRPGIAPPQWAHEPWSGRALMPQTLSHVR